MSNPAVKKAGQALVAAFAAFIEAVVDNTSAPASKPEPKVKAAPAPKAEKPPKAEKAPKKVKAPSTLKEHAEAAIAGGKFKGNTKEGKLLASYVASKDLRSAEARAMAAEVATLLGLPPPKRPGPAPKAEKAPKAETKPKAEKAPKPPKAEKAPKAKAAPKAGGTLKDQAQAALTEGKFKGNTKEGKLLQSFIDMKDGRSQEARAAAVEVCKLLGLPPPKKPGPAPKAKPEKAAATPKAKKGTPSGKGETDAAVESPTPGPSKSTGVKPAEKSSASSSTKPRAVEAVEMVLAEGGAMNVVGVHKALEEKGWMPESADPKTYIYFILTNNTDKFEKAPDKPKGYYQVVGSPPKTSNGSSNGASNGASNGEAHSEPPPASVEASSDDEDPPAAAADENPFDDEILGEP